MASYSARTNSLSLYLSRRYPGVTTLVFLSVLCSTLLRRALLRSVRALVQSPAWSPTVAAMESLRAVDFGAVADVLEETASIPAALNSPAVSTTMKSA